MWERNVVYTKQYDSVPPDEREIFRYAKTRGDTAREKELLAECLESALPAARLRVCFGIFDVKTDGRNAVFPFGSFASADLARLLSGSDAALVFAATAGGGIDRLIMKYSSLSPARALMYEAIGNERAEAACDALCEEIEREPGLQGKLTARFSPGYGDLDLATQKVILPALNAERLIGVTLGEALIMSPSKSVTAVCGIKSDAKRFLSGGNDFREAE